MSLSLYGTGDIIGSTFPFAQCYLSLSAGNLVLSPKNGNLLNVGGTVQIIPSSGISLAPTGLLASTLYYIYTYMNTGTMTLEASTTSYTVSTITGLPYKTGDTTRTLVGMAYVGTTAATFTDSSTQRYVLSWFNRQQKYIYAPVLANRTVSATSIAEINSADRAEFATWADGSINLQASSCCNTSSNGIFGYIGIGVDGAYEVPVQEVSFYSSANPQMPFNSVFMGNASEGYHYTSMWGSVSSSSMTQLSSQSAIRGYVEG